MKHYDEHTIELYFLEDPQVSPISDEIKEHLAICFSCNEIYEKLKEFYSEVERTNELPENEKKLLFDKSPVNNSQFLKEPKKDFYPKL